MKNNAKFLFEVSWEICNKVGGIYTVVKSKAAPMKEYYKDNFFMVGPYTEKRHGEFTEKNVPQNFREIFEELESMGIVCHYGTWLTDGEPSTILIDFENFKYRLNDIKKEFWDLYKIDSLNTQYFDFDQPILWSYAAGILIEKFSKSNKDVVSHCHEWLSGGCVLYLKSKGLPTVFTTHATMLGRTLAGNNVELYSRLKELNPDEEAYRFQIQAKFLTEKVCAHNASVFTTVSEITGIEAEHLLGKKPDVLLPNGLDIEKFPTFDDASVKHKLLKSKAKRFLQFYFFPYYQFELDDTLLFFLAGRYEFHNKGIDIYIRALGKLNEHLKESKSEKTVVAFVWVPTQVRNIKQEILENRSYFEDVEDSLRDNMEDLNSRLIYGIVGEKKVDEEFLLGKQLLKETKKRLAKFKKEGLPPVCTHNLPYEDDDAIIKEIRVNNLNNLEGDRVKIIFYPVYLSGADQLLDLNYYESIMASHFGVFPSYYEPWGYTPAETGALGVASVTTDLAGFGRYLKKKKQKDSGIFVIDRHNKSDDDSVKQLSELFKRYVSFSKQERIDNKLSARKLASIADWKKLVENYINAHNMAIE